MTYTLLRRALRTALSSRENDFSSDPAYEADEILRILCGRDRASLLLHGSDSVEDTLADACLSAAARRADGTPLAYILGKSPFCGHDYFCAPGCLIPRADTEILVEETVSRLPVNGVLWDLCTGTGCIPCAVLLARREERPGPGFCDASRAWGVELYDVPLALAEKNGVSLGLSERFFPCRGDVLAGDCPPDAPSPDIITANPPYIPSSVCETLDSQVKKEPLSALCGGEDGLDFYRAILVNYKDRLKPGGCFLFEIGYDQGEALRRLSAEHGFPCGIRKDYAGHDRTAILKKPEGIPS